MQDSLYIKKLHKMPDTMQKEDGKRCNKHEATGKNGVALIEEVHLQVLRMEILF